MMWSDEPRNAFTGSFDAAGTCTATTATAAAAATTAAVAFHRRRHRHRRRRTVGCGGCRDAFDDRRPAEDVSKFVSESERNGRCQIRDHQSRRCTARHISSRSASSTHHQYILLINETCPP